MRAGAHIDATYICPHAPSEEAPCACRKPGVALFERAARDHDLDLARSWYAGDKWRDVEPGLTLGGSAFLIPAPSTPPEELRESARAGHRAAVARRGRAGDDHHPYRRARAAIESARMSSRIAVLVSGRGSNLQALHAYLERAGGAEVALVVSDRASSGALTWARERAIATAVLDAGANEAASLARLVPHAPRRIRRARRVPSPRASRGRARLSPPHGQRAPRPPSGIRRSGDVRPPRSPRRAAIGRASERAHRSLRGRDLRSRASDRPVARSRVV